MILCSSGTSLPGLDWRTSVSYNVLAGAQCPVFVLPNQPSNAGNHDINVMVPEKVPAYSESVKASFRKEKVLWPSHTY